MKTILFTSIFAVNLFAAFEYSNSNAFVNGTAGSSIASSQFFSGFLLNPAVSADLEAINVGLTYSRPYGISELVQAGIIANYLHAPYGIGVSFSSFGNNVFRESRLSFNLSRLFLDDKVSIGTNLHWYSIHAENYEIVNSLGVDVGVFYKISPSVNTGFSVQNINQPKIRNHAEELPLVTSWGFSFMPDEHISTYVAVQKDAWHPLAIHCGVNVRANSYFSLQSGFSSYPSVPALGVHFKQNWFNLAYVFQYHFELGATHLWGISLTRHKNTE